MKYLYAIILSLCLATSAFAYDYPIGIPHPWIEPDIPTPSRPADWSSEVAGYYYINYQTGSDSRTYGTPSNPRATIPNPAPAGAYIEVHGTYNYLTGGDIEIYPNGTSGSPVWLVGLSGDEPTFKDGKLFVSGSYLYIDNIKVDVNGAWPGVQFGSLSSGYPAGHVMIRNSSIVGINQAETSYGISVVGSSTDSVDNIIIYNNTIHDISWDGPPQPPDRDAEAVSTGDYASYTWVLDNTMYNIAGAGGSVGSADTSRDSSAEQHHQYYGRNEIYHTWGVGIAGKFNVDVVLSENHIHDIYDTSWSPAKGLGMQYDGDRTWFIFNTIHGMRYGIRYPGNYNNHVVHSYVIGNLIYDINQDAHDHAAGEEYVEAAIMLAKSSYNYVVNNTIYNSYSGISLGNSDVTVYNDVENNIVVDSHLLGDDLWIANTSGTNTIKNNIFHSTNGQEQIRWGSTVYDLAGFQAASGLGQNCVTSDPQFVDLARRDFHLQSTSPARDAALASTALSTDVYALFQSTFGVDLKKDIEDKVRPQGSAWDMGAYEYIDGSGPTCSDGIQNGDETGTDCGGSCPPCATVISCGTSPMIH